MLALSSGVEQLKIGDHVLIPLYSFSWRERLVVPAAQLFALPHGDLRQLAMAGINPPTAALLLSQFIDLKPSDWVAQNAANSGVGRSLIAIARTRGLRTINFVRRAELVPELEATGGDLVLLDVEGALDKVRVVGGGDSANHASFALSDRAAVISNRNVGTRDVTIARRRLPIEAHAPAPLQCSTK